MDHLLRHNCWAGETLEPCEDVFVPSFFLCCAVALTVDYLLTRSSMRSCLNMSPELETIDK